MESAGGRENPHVAFCAGDGGVDEVALQHYIVAGVEHHDDGGVFAALALVDGAGVGELQFVQFFVLVGDEFFIEEDGDFPLFLVDAVDDSDVAVEHVLVVVVLDLHDAVAHAPADAHHLVARNARVQQVLQEGVQLDDAEGTLAHGNKNLQVGFKVDIDFAFDTGGDESL